MAESFILDVPFQIDLDRLLKRLRVESGSQYAAEVRGLAGDAQAVGRPEALYRVAFIESRGDDYVVIDNVVFTSRVLRVNLDSAHRVFAYVATCGMELEDWANSIRDVLHRYWAETIKEMALHAATKVLNEHLVERYRPGRTATMSPGRLADWPSQSNGRFSPCSATQEMLSAFSSPTVS